MRHTSVFKLLLVFLALLLAHTARAQGTDVVPFEAQNDELQGSILMVENNMLFMERNGVSYSFAVSAGTRITIGRHPANLEDLAARKGRPVIVKFRVTPEGNMAQEIAVTGGMNLSWRERGMMHGRHEMDDMHEMHQMHDMHGAHGMHAMPETCPMRGGTS